jgi:phage portal protein BeeE
MTRLWDRVLARADPAHEDLLSGAYYVATTDPSGRGKEAAVGQIVRSAREAYASNGIVWACAVVRMSLLSEAEFCFRSAVDKHLFTNQDLDLLQHPWPNATEGELLARLEQDGGTTAGNAYFRRATPADGGDDLLVQMRPDCVTIISQESRDNRGRIFRRPIAYQEDLRQAGVDQDAQIYTVDEVAHYSPVPDPAASWRGMSWLTPVLREVGADLALTRYKTAHLQNGAMPGIAVKYSQKLSDKTVQTLARRLSAKYGGPDNAGTTWVLDEGADPQVIGSTLEQLQFDAVTKAGERRVAAAAQVPLEVLGLEGGDYQAAMRRMADTWARPAWRMACASLEHLIPTSADIGPVKLWYDVAGVAALREGELQRAQAFLVKSQGLASAVTAGYTRESAVQAADACDISLLVKDPRALPPGGQRPPQAGKPQDLPGVGHPNLPNAMPEGFQPVPAVPGGPRGNGVNGRRKA